MTLRTSNVLRAGAVLAIVLGAASGASADVVWTLHDVTLSDGGTLSGTFSVDVYDDLDALNLSSTAGTVLGATTYDGDNGGNSSISISNSKTAVAVNYDDSYANTLYLEFATPLTRSSHDDAIVSGYECFDSYSCSGAPLYRTVQSGFASAPEPTSWALMTVGVGCVAGALRSGRRRPVIA